MTTSHQKRSSGNLSEEALSIGRALLVCAAFTAVAIPLAISTTLSTPGSLPATTDAAATPVARFAEFGAEKPSTEAQYLANWIADTRDNATVDFVIVDKKFARVFVFDADARLRSSAPVLLGSARGDDSVPGIGTRPIPDVRPEERTTPAGRFIAERGRNTLGEDVVWVDYEAAVSMHRVRTVNPKERRLERLASPTVTDNRISYGCINVPVGFYDTYIRPIFANHRAVVYVMPEIKSLQQVFGAYDVAAKHGVSIPKPSTLQLWGNK